MFSMFSIHSLSTANVDDRRLLPFLTSVLSGRSRRPSTSAPKPICYIRLISKDFDFSPISCLTAEVDGRRLLTLSRYHDKMHIPLLMWDVGQISTDSDFCPNPCLGAEVDGRQLLTTSSFGNICMGRIRRPWTFDL